MNRKEFMRYAAGLAATTALAPTWLASAAPTQIRPVKSPWKISLKYGMVQEDLSLLDKFKLLKDLGFDGVELDSPNQLDRKEILAAQDATGLEIPGVVNSMHWSSPLSSPDPKVRARCVASMETAIADCQAYGGSTVLLVPAVVNQEVSYQDAYQRSQTEIRKLIPLAEKTGIKIALENVWNNFLLSPMEAARYVDEFESLMVGWYFDVGNIVRYGWPTHWIATLGHRIIKIDAKEYSRKKQQEEGIWKGFEVELMEGDCNWPAVLAALEKVNYLGGWASAEVPGGDRKRLETVAERMKAIFKA